MKKREKYNEGFRIDVSFVNRQKELAYLKNYMNTEPFEILFLHGPQSSGKTTLLYEFFDRIQEEQELDIKFLNLRKKSIHNYQDFVNIFFGIDTTNNKSREDVVEKREYGIFGFSKLTVEEQKGIKNGNLDPFEVMERQFLKLKRKGIKPVIIIDELQAIEHIYLKGSDGNNTGRQVIIELFNFFVAMTKESHLAHIIIASSDGYFLKTIFNDSRLLKSSNFYKVDYLIKDDVMDWLLNLEKYSKIKDYTLSETEAEKIWDTVGGSMLEIQDILSDLFENPLDEVLALYKRKMRGIIAHYIAQKDRAKREKILQYFVNHDKLQVRDTYEGQEEPLRDMVKNNILYFDPTDATYFPQGASTRWGIRLFFET